MRVRAITKGYYGDQRKKPGEEFDLVPRKGFKRDSSGTKKKPIELSPEDQFSDTWMEKVEQVPFVPPEVSVAPPKRRPGRPAKVVPQEVI